VRRLCSTVLIMEAVVVALAIVPSIALGHMNGGTAGAIGGAIAVVAIGLAGCVGRPGMRWALYAGSVLQLLVIAVGVIMPAMYVLGVIFAALWFTGIWLGRKVESANRGAPAGG